MNILVKHVEVKGSCASIRAVAPDVQELLQEALWFRSWGWSVFPLSRRKTPLAPWKCWQNGRPRDKEIGPMFTRRPSKVGGLAVVLGRISGRDGAALAVRDFDTEDGYVEWSKRRPDLARTLPTVKTRRGHHVYFLLRGREQFIKLKDGDLRADRGHYAVLPPSIHPSGVFYRWLIQPWKPSDIPVLTLDQTGFIECRTRTRAAQPTAEQRPVNQPSKNKMACVPSSGCPASDSGQLECPDDLPGAVKEAVLRNLPRRAGERNDRLLALAQALKDIAPDVVAAHWVGAVGYWRRCAFEVIATKDMDTTWKDFARAWRRAATPTSLTKKKLALTTAAAKARPGGPMAAILAACRALAAETDGDFYISARDAAKAARVSKSTAHRLLGRAVRDGLLDVVKPGKPSAIVRLATVYRLGTTRTQEQGVAA